MADAKLDVKIGAVSFVGEGSETWLAEQLKTILEIAPKVSVALPTSPAQTPQPPAALAGTGTVTQTLASYLTTKSAGTNQVKRFLVAADWLRLKGQTLSTAAVTKALKDNHQTKVGNPADCLNQNVGKGFAEKTADGFFITPEGLKSLGHTA